MLLPSHPSVTLDHPDVYIDEFAPRKLTPLYGLEPLQDGFGFRESLRNYIARLAAEHLLTLRRFIENAVGPICGLGTSGAHLAMGFMSRSLSPAAFGMKSATEELVAVLQGKTARTDLTSLTLLPLRGLVSGEALYARFARHCPECFEDDRRRGMPPFERLIWLVRPLRACPVHGCRIVPSECGTAAVTTTSRSVRIGHPGYCSACGSPGLTCRTSKPEKASPSDRWAARQIAALLETGRCFADDNRAQRHMKDAILAEASRQERGIAGIAEAAALSKTTLWTWLKRPDAKTSLETLLAVCASQGWNLGDMADGTPSRQASGATPHALGRRPRSRRTIDHEAIRSRLKQVNQENAPLSLHDLSLELGVTPKHLRSSFPELAAELVAKREWRLELRRELELEVIREEVVSVLLELVNAGQRVTTANVAALGRKGWTRGGLRCNLLALVCFAMDIPAFGNTYRGEKLERLKDDARRCVQEAQRRLGGGTVIDDVSSYWTDEVDEAQRAWEVDLDEARSLLERSLR